MSAGVILKQLRKAGALIATNLLAGQLGLDTTNHNLQFSSDGSDIHSLLTADPEYNAGNSGTSLTINWRNGRVQLVTMNGNCTFTFSNPISGRMHFLKLVEDGTGNRVPVWPGNVIFPGGVNPLLGGPSAVDLIGLYYDGTNYYGNGYILVPQLYFSATDKILGRLTAGAGPGELIACTAAGRALLDDANAAAQLVTLGAVGLASPAFTGTPTAPTAAAGTDTTQLATTAFVKLAAPNVSYRTILDSTGSHTAARVAGKYGMGQGDPIAIDGTGTLYPLNTIYLSVGDHPTINGLLPKLRIRAQLNVNNVAPTGDFTFGLYPITRPGSSGGTGLLIYTIGTVISGSNGATVSAPAADAMLSLIGGDFDFPTDGHYIIGVVTTATVAATSHLHMSAQLQMRNA